MLKHFIKPFLFILSFIACNITFAAASLDALETKFNTGGASFGAEYAKLAHHQATFNAQIIKDLSDSIGRWFPRTSETPLKILDLCCGHGKPTHDLLEELDKRGIHVEKITGYDISEAQIEVAKANYKDVARLSFFTRDAESIDEENVYDLVVSLFGFHWVENLPRMAELSAKALKPAGKVMFFVPLEKMDLVGYRRSFMEHSKWKDFFAGYTLYPFIDNPEAYTEAFDRYFVAESEHTKKGERSILYTNDEFVRFLSSWLQELRYLKTKGVECGTYVSEMVDSIPTLTEGNVRKQAEGGIVFTEHFFSYQGTLRSAGASATAGCGKA